MVNLISGKSQNYFPAHYVGNFVLNKLDRYGCMDGLDQRVWGNTSNKTGSMWAGRRSDSIYHAVYESSRFSRTLLVRGLKRLKPDYSDSLKLFKSRGVSICERTQQ